MGNLGLSESLTTEAKLAADLAIVVAEGSPGNLRGALSHRKRAASPHPDPHMCGLFAETVDRLGCATLPRIARGWPSLLMASRAATLQTAEGGCAKWAW